MGNSCFRSKRAIDNDFILKLSPRKDEDQNKKPKGNPQINQKENCINTENSQNSSEKKSEIQKKNLNLLVENTSNIQIISTENNLIKPNGKNFLIYLNF